MNKNTDERSLRELIVDWQDENRVHNFEGSSGIERFEKLLKVIGYADGNFFNDVLRNFLSDNSGAIEAIIEWIGAREVDEWADALRDEVAPPADDDLGVEDEE